LAAHSLWSTFVIRAVEQSLRQRAPQAIDHGRALADDASAAGRRFTQIACGRIRLPEFGEITQPEQVRQHCGSPVPVFTFALATALIHDCLQVSDPRAERE
jgi:hypothetical protein